MAWQQMQWYQRQVEAGVMEFVTSGTGLPPVHQGTHGRDAHATGSIKAILLLEGADALRTPDDVKAWFDAGLRIVGLAWKRTRFAGGTAAPGPLTAEGVTLVKALDAHRIIH